MGEKFFEIAPRMWVNAAGVDAIKFRTFQDEARTACCAAVLLLRNGREFEARGAYADRIEAAMTAQGAEPTE